MCTRIIKSIMKVESNPISFATIHHHVQAANWLAAGAANGLFRNNSSASSNIPLSCDHALCRAPSQVTRQEDPWIWNACRVSVLHFSSFKLNHLKIPSTSHMIHMVRAHVQVCSKDYRFSTTPGHRTSLGTSWQSRRSTKGGGKRYSSLLMRCLIWGYLMMMMMMMMMKLIIMHPKISETHSTNYMRW